jgi:glycosyltransferase involved in cell wall biosynthesis
MKIVHINTSDKSGGAAIAAFRLHNAMKEAGIDSIYFVQNRTIHDREDIKTVSKYERHIKRYIRLVCEKITIHAMHNMPGLFSSFKYGVDVSKYPEIISTDIIYLHWICGSFINYRTLKKILKIGKPVFWFMHDMFPITGGCHYSFNCSKYYSRCYDCPYYKKNVFLPDISFRQFSIKRRIYKQFDNLAFIAPSTWLAGCAQKSGLTRDKRIYYVPNLIDPERFKPLNKNTARELFCIKQNRKVITFGADNALSNPYKGWNYFRDALHFLAKENVLPDTVIEVLIFGINYNKKIADDIPFTVHFFGRLHDEYSMVMVYNCADVFVIPSLAENFSNTIIESLACNTPVVGFDVGGIPDTVNDDTGYLAKYKDSHDLAKGIALVLREGKGNVRIDAEKFFSTEVLKGHISINNYGCKEHCMQSGGLQTNAGLS